MKKIIPFIALLFLQGILLAQSKSVYFADYPTLTPDGQTIIFTYSDDLWSVPVDGGTAQRLTAMDGREVVPKVSPDGKWLSFTGTQYGNSDVYLMPLKGGSIQQLTFHETYDEVASWSWDSKNHLLYFRVATIV